MRELTPEEKEQLQAMLDRQSVEQKKKRRRYRNYKSIMHASRYSGNAEERLENLESKHDKIQRQISKHSELKTIQLTEEKKRSLEAKIREAV